MRLMILRVSLFLLLATVSFKSDALLNSFNVSAAKATVATASGSLRHYAFICTAYCCGRITEIGGFEYFGFTYGWAHVIVSCQDGSSCYIDIQAECAGDLCSVTVGSNC